jgi:glycosyltransferase involved in cell wall biosynthesis
LEKSKKILLVSPLPPPIGGIASWTIHVLDYLSNLDYVNDSNFLHFNSNLKFRNVVLDSLFLRIIFGSLEVFWFLPRIFYVLLSFRPSVLHYTSSGSFGFFKDLVLVLFCYFLKIDVILHIRFGRVPQILKNKDWEFFLFKKLLQKASTVLFIDTPSFNAASLFFPMHACRFKFIPNPASLESTKHALCPPDPKSDLVLFVGHVISSKGVIELSKGFSRLNSKFKLEFIGPEVLSVKNQILSIFSDSGFYNFEFFGPKEKEIVYSKMKEASLLVLPSYSEGFPNVVLEAMAHGCPVLATSVGAIPEMLGCDSINQAGICFDLSELNNIEQFLLSSLLETTNLEAMGINGKKRVLTYYSMDVVMPQYLQLWGF